MKTPPFESARAKIDNARDHIDKVEALFATYQKQHPLKAVEKILDEERLIRFEPSEPIPNKVMLAAGDAIHNLRSSLDYMANVAIFIDTGIRKKGIHFPTSDTKVNLSAQFKDKMPGASAILTDLIYAFEPYRGGKMYLRSIHELDLIDKHNYLIATAHGAELDFETDQFRMRGVISSKVAPNISISIYSPLIIHSPPVAQLHFKPIVALPSVIAVTSLRKFSEMTEDVGKALAHLFSVRW